MQTLSVMSIIDLKLLVVALHLIIALASSNETCESDVQTLISANNASKGNKFHLKVKTYILLISNKRTASLIHFEIFAP